MDGGRLTSAIAFTGVGKAEIVDHKLRESGPEDVLVRTLVSAVSAGTERANLMCMPNTPQKFPAFLGYSACSVVEETGSRVKDFAPGDRVLVYHGIHAERCVVRQDQLTKVTDPAIDPLEAAFIIIASMGLGGVRKTEIELGEPAMVIGLGLLGMFAVQTLALSGAHPLIAADFDEDRLALARKLGADHALSPRDPDFAAKVRGITGGRGVSATVEVTGSSAALREALDCASFMGRIVLLGCTRVPEGTVDYYAQVHKPGVRIIGAHNFVRPKVDSYPHHWTHQDDCRCLLSLLSAGKLRVRPMISEVHAPADAPEVYARLAENKLPLGVAFRWE